MKKKKLSYTNSKRKSVVLVEQLQLAVDEADNLLNLSAEERLKSCLFRYETGSKFKEVEDIIRGTYTLYSNDYVRLYTIV